VTSAARREIIVLLCITVGLAFAVAALALDRYAGGYGTGMLTMIAIIFLPLLLLIIVLIRWVAGWSSAFELVSATPVVNSVPAPAPVVASEVVHWEDTDAGASLGIWELNPATGGVSFSPALQHMLGYAAETSPATLAAWRALIHPEDQAKMRTAFENLLAGRGDACHVAYRMHAKSGDYRWVDTSARLLRDQAGRPRLIRGAIADITVQRELEQRIEQLVAGGVDCGHKLREANAVFDTSDAAIMITDHNGLIRRVNPAFTQMTGYTETEVIGCTPRILNSGRQDEAFYKNMWESLTVQGCWEGELWNRRKDGVIFPVAQTVTTIRDEQASAVGYVSLLTDLTQKKRDEDEIAYRANYDPLTGLPNRNLLAERLMQALKQGRRENTRSAVMFIDLDFFKQVNDTLGHAVGDRLLQLVADRMRVCVRETDTIARLGGDEFVILLTDIDAAAPASIVAEKLIAQMVEAFVIEGNEIHIGASVGITICPDDGVDVDTLFRNADLAMYRAKSKGRNNAQFFEAALTTAALDRRALENDMRSALLRQEFRLHFLPQVDMISGRITGVESLLRWQHPQRGLLAPDAFVPLAEETGLIRDIGVWALEESCRQLAAWDAAGHRLTMALNISIRQLPEALAVGNILAELARHRIDPQRIVLEFTEGVLRTEAPAIQQWFVDAGDAGLHLAIDDFGSGYSSLLNLKRFPIRHVKIDKSFVKDMAGNAGHRALIEAILALAHSLGLSVVAEGVENTGQATLLQERACEHAQGYLYSRPLPAEDLLTLLDSLVASAPLP
jgi:diguanylate cyclase (GGDEF)-like protein/PAS domain S-box-containing protein